jgi:hypothetical protein
MASISIPKTTEEKIKIRAGAGQTFSGQINDDLTLCWALLDRGRLAIREVFTRPEIMVLLEVQHGTVWDATQLSMWIRGGLAHQVSDGIALDGGRLRDLESVALLDFCRDLLAKVNSLRDLETVALLDFCRDMWRHSDDQGYWDAELERFTG